MAKQSRRFLLSNPSRYEASSAEEPLLTEEDEIRRDEDEPIWTSSLATTGASGQSFHGDSLQTAALMSEITSSSARGLMSPSSPTEGPTSAKEPLLVDEEGKDTESTEIDQATQSDNVEKKPFISPEYQLTISHFIVS
jgi:hypothetical protein